MLKIFVVGMWRGDLCLMRCFLEGSVCVWMRWSLRCGGIWRGVCQRCGGNWIWFMISQDTIFGHASFSFSVSQYLFSMFIHYNLNIFILIIFIFYRLYSGWWLLLGTAGTVDGPHLCQGECEQQLRHWWQYLLMWLVLASSLTRSKLSSPGLRTRAQDSLYNTEMEKKDGNLDR